MKTEIALLICCCFACINLGAQELSTPVPKTFHRESGIFGQSGSNNGGNQSLDIAGLQYKHWRNEHFGFRVIAAFAQHQSYGEELQYARGDTFYTRQQRFNISLPVVGFGLEAQRHFYKNVYLFAATELNAGYGEGNVDTVVERRLGNRSNATPVFESEGNRDASLLLIGMTASIGAKLQFRRVCVGVELLPVQFSYRRLDDGIRAVGMGEMYLGTFGQRLFLHFRF